MNTGKTRILAIGLFLLGVRPATGLECPPRASVADALSRATAVFSGEVVAEEYRRVDYSASGGVGEARVLVVKFKVERWWKGGDAEDVFLYTSVMKTPDGRRIATSEEAFFSFRKGESYLVYAYGPPDKLRTSGCARTKNLTQAGEDLRELGEGNAPKRKQE